MMIVGLLNVSSLSTMPASKQLYKKDMHQAVYRII